MNFCSYEYIIICSYIVKIILQCHNMQGKEFNMLLDKDIREPLFDFLEDTFGQIRILEEKKTGRSRADVVMVTPEHVIGIEIKSDADTYARLDSQVRDYSLYYDRNLVAVGSRHAMNIEKHVPDSWGIITIDEVDGEADFYLLRYPSENPSFKHDKLISTLWRPELNRLLAINELPRYPAKSKAFVIAALAERVPWETLLPQITEELFQRDYTTIADEINAYREEHGKKPRTARRKRRRRRKTV